MMLYLLVNFKASPQTTVKWFCNGKPISPSSNKYDISYDTKTNQHKLIIKNITLNDSENYSTKTSNKLGQIQTKAKLTVTNASDFISDLQDKTVIAKDTVELNVKVTGTPQPTLTCLKAGKEIKSDKKTKNILLYQLIKMAMRNY
jgi:Immunoglobulin I-set domain